MNNAITLHAGNALLPDAQSWKTMLDMAETLVKSGMLPAHIKTPQAAVAIIQKGLELGVPPMYALSNIVHIQGKPTANSELMLALIYRDHGDAAVGFQESTADHCTVAYRRRGWAQPGLFTFTMKEAEAAGLLKNQVWRSYPAAMLRARAISAVARMAFPDSIGGMYTPEELGATVDADGDVIDVPSTPQRPTDSRPTRPHVEVVEVDGDTGEIIDAPMQVNDPSAGHPATERQIKAIFGIGRSKGLSDDQIKEEIYGRFGVTSKTELLSGQASELIDAFNAIDADSDMQPALGM